MKRSSLAKHEKALKWERKEVDKRVEKLLLSQAEPIAKSLADQAVNGSFQAQAYVLDRLFGKPKQSMDIESAGQPIVFMPGPLIAKFGLDKPVQETELPIYVEKKDEE